MTTPDPSAARNPCISCGGDAWRHPFVARNFQGQSFRYVSCASCGLVELDRGVDTAGAGEVYEEAYYGEGPSKFADRIQSVRQRHAQKKAARISSLCPGQPGRLFDVGCGDGLFMEAMLKRGWSVDANEVGPAALARAQKLTSTKLGRGDLLDIVVAEGSYDVVTIWQVLEHVTRPAETLQKAFRMLKPGGLLTVSVPNAGSWQARLFGSQWFHMDPPHHVHLFTPDNLSALLNRHGFNPFLFVGNPLEFGPFGYVQSFMNMMGLRKDSFFELLKSKALTDRRLSVHQWMMMGLAGILTPPSVLLALMESPSRCSGTFEMYAKAKR